MFDDPMAMVKIFGYTQGCEACGKVKELLWRHNITYTFIPVGKKESGCVQRKWLVSQGHDTVPQVYLDQTYIGNYGTLKNHLEPQEVNHEINSMLGWLPKEPARIQAAPKDAMSNQTLETQTKGVGTIEEVVETQRETVIRPAVSTGTSG